jgi:hypothetical protein
MDSIVTIGGIISVVQILKGWFPFISGWVTPVVAALIGGAWSFLNGGDVVKGVILGLSSSGATTLADKAVVARK